MKKILMAGALFIAIGSTALIGGASTAFAFCTATQSCKATVTAGAKAIQQRNASGSKWVLSPAGCEKASREQEANENRCRGYDEQGTGKTFAQCAKCYNQAVFDAQRWKACNQIGAAPPVPSAIYASIARLGKAAKATQ